jgi:hypothetical protein
MIYSRPVNPLLFIPHFNFVIKPVRHDNAPHFTSAIRLSFIYILTSDRDWSVTDHILGGDESWSARQIGEFEWI